MMGNLKIGLDVAQTCRERAGCAHYADALARALAERDDVELTLYHQFGNWLNTEPQKGTCLEGVAMPFLETPYSEAAKFWGQNPIPALPGDPALVHSASFQCPQVRGVKSVMTIYDVSFWTVPEYTTEANRLNCQRGVLEGMRWTDGILFISRSAREEFEAIFPNWMRDHEVDHEVVLLGNRVAVADPIPYEDREPYWLAVGSIEPRKNYDLLLTVMEEYWKRSRAPKPLKVMGGKGWLSEGLKERMQRLGERGLVDWQGYASDEALSRAYRHAFGYLCASWYEGFGLPLLEALASGTPSVTSDRTSLPEVGGEAALYCKPDSSEQMVELMLALEEAEEDWRERSRSSVSWARRFTWQRTAEETVAFYRRVLESGRPARVDAGR